MWPTGSSGGQVKLRTTFEKEEEVPNSARLRHGKLFVSALGRLKPDLLSCSSAIAACASEGLWAEALEFLAQIPGHPDVPAMNAVMTACAEAGEWERAFLLLQQFRLHHLVPDVVSFNSVMAACDHGQQWDLALWLFGQLRTLRLRPSLISFSSAASACEKAKQWMQAVSLLLTLQQSGLQADDIAFNTVTSACGHGQQWKKALGILGCREVCGLPWALVTCNAAISACAAGLATRVALAFLRRLRVEHLHPSEVTWNAVMEACGDAWQLSLELLREMEEQRSEVNILALASAVSSLHRGRAGGKLAGQLEELRTSALCRSRLLAEPERINRALSVGWLRSMPSCMLIGKELARASSKLADYGQVLGIQLYPAPTSLRGFDLDGNQP
ncbi:unnamed protein product [Symbiodinium sp. CCMP2592]|nr:unnamed protein product [Symbiodinium sp. CCMP2592]